MKNTKRIVIVIIVSLVVVVAGMTALKGIDRSASRSGIGNDMAFEESMPAGLAEKPLFKGLSRLSGELATESVQFEDATDVQVDKKVIKNGSMTVKVDRTDDAVGKISEIAKNNEGEIFSSNFHQTSKKVKSGNIIVKVPTANFEKTFNEIKEIASLVVRESTSGKDVTDQYTDLQSRLKNKQAEEQSIAKILEQSGKISDVLAVTKELARVRGEIEMLQGRIRLMDSQIDMATINVSLSEDPDITVVDSWRPLQVIKDALNDLIKSVQQFIDFMIALVIRTIPILLIYLVVIMVVYWAGKKIYNRFKKPE